MKMCCNPFFLYEKIIICKDFVFDFEKGAILEGQFERKGPFHFRPQFSDGCKNIHIFYLLGVRVVLSPEANI